MTENEGPWEDYIEKTVKIDTLRGSTYSGIIKQTNMDYTLLCPVLVNETIDNNTNYRLEKKIPAKIVTGDISAVVPYSKGFLEKIVNHYKKPKKKRKSANKK
jgi:hypothetical protein